mmetsp:Transcript_14981/g.43186  ORF Transcript_14981/g.43186 Transcript_14981/m.43186 type:complete len:269 (-) Transcript_14981:389-1195(-)
MALATGGGASTGGTDMQATVRLGADGSLATSLDMPARLMAPVVSPGRRAAERVQQKNKSLADKLRREREGRLHAAVAKAPKASTGGGRRTATQEQLVRLSETMNKRLIELYVDPRERCWYKFFIHMDDDCSGKVNFEELVDMVRNELRISSAALPEMELEALWGSLDEDGSGLITTGEFGHFMRLGSHVHGPRTPWKERKTKAAQDAAATLRSQKEELLEDLKRRLEADQAARRQKVNEAYSSMWGSTVSSSSMTSQQPWRSSRAFIF